jgi:hypothetical protein
MLVGFEVRVGPGLNLVLMGVCSESTIQGAPMRQQV